MKEQVVAAIVNGVVVGLFGWGAIYFTYYLRRRKKKPESPKQLVTKWGVFIEPKTIQQRRQEFTRREYLSGFGLLGIAAFQMFIAQTDTIRYFIVPFAILFIACTSWMLKKYILMVILGIPSLAVVLFYWIFM